jgi:integrase
LLSNEGLEDAVTLNNGVPIETVAKMMGHSNIKTTQIYAKVLDHKISGDMAVLRSKLGINYNQG